MGWNAPLNEKTHARDIEHGTDMGGCAWTRALCTDRRALIVHECAVLGARALTGVSIYRKGTGGNGASVVRC